MQSRNSPGALEISSEVEIIKAKILAFALVAVTVGMFSFTRPKNTPPSDLRDAVADNFNAAIPVFEKGSGNIPAPNGAVADEAVVLGVSKGYDAGNAKLDSYVESARTLHKIMGSYLGNKSGFGYQLKQGPISINVDASGIFGNITEKFPFLSGISAGGAISINPGQKIVSQFNALKTEYYGVLLEAAHIDPSDSRVAALAEWGKDTEVIYPGEHFGEPVIEFMEYSKLHLR